MSERKKGNPKLNDNKNMQDSGCVCVHETQRGEHSIMAGSGGVLYLYLSVGTDGRHGQSGDDGYKIAKRHDHQALH